MDNPLVFVHGAGDSARAWRAQVAYFGTRAYALNLPGHGERPDTLPELAGVAEYARAVWTMVDAELRLERPIIVGHSLGGLIALQMGLDFGEQLGGLVLVGTGARMRVAPVLLEAARTDPAQALRILKDIPIAEQNDPALSVSNEQNAPQSRILYRDLMACNGFDVMDRLEKLRNLPTLILCGAEERNAPVKYSTYLRDHIPGSALQIIPAAGHYVQRQKPEEVNRVIAEWLAGN
ncbi:MAG TPA: alpha/beta hydrolase [Ktedonobacteraceae bacterium]|jgi:pimeloyl-ACP methyl ester carboxylesterase